MNFIVNNRLIIILAGIASAMLTMWAITVDPIVNPDAILYFSVADEFALGNFSNAFTLYKWPFYSGFIAFVQAITGLSTQNSAYLLNSILYIIAVFGFLACVHALGANQRTLVIAAILILLFPSLNKYRAFIIRDAGFIAFYLWMIFHLIQGINKQQFSNFVWASVFIVLATLFRIEAIVPLLILPVYLQYLRSRGNKRIFWMLMTGVVSFGVFIGMSVWLFGEHASRTDSGLTGFFSAAIDHAMESIEHRSISIKQYVLTPFSEDMAPTILWVSVILITIYEPLRRLSFVFAYFSWHAIKTKLVLNKNSLRKVFYALCFIQLSLMAIFTAINMYLVSRHALALVLTILLLAPFSMNYFYEKWFFKKENKSQWKGICIILLLALIGLEGLDIKTNKHGIKEQGEWLENQISSEYSVYSNSQLLLHYAGRKPAYLNLRYNWDETNHMLFTKEIFDFDYAAIEIEKTNESAKKYIQKTIGTPAFLEKDFSNGKKLLVYDLRNNTKNTGLHPKYFKLKNKPIF